MDICDQVTRVIHDLTCEDDPIVHISPPTTALTNRPDPRLCRFLQLIPINDINLHYFEVFEKRAGLENLLSGGVINSDGHYRYDVEQQDKSADSN
jgi:hypothetical protein